MAKADSRPSPSSYQSPVQRLHARVSDRMEGSIGSFSR